MARILPDFNFQPVVSPLISLPTDEYDTSLSRLNTRYDTTLENLDLYQQAQGSLRPAGFDADQQAYNELIGDFNKRYTSLAERPDLENVMRDATKLNTSFKASAIPLEQRRQIYQNLSDKTLTLASQNKLDANRTLEAIKALERKSPSLIKTEDGRFLNTLDEGKFTPLLQEEANLSQVVDDAVKGFIQDEKVKQYFSEKTLPDGRSIAQLLNTKRISEFTPQEVQAIAQAALEADTRSINRRQKEELFGSIQTGVDEQGNPIYLENRFDTEARRAVDQAVAKYANKQEAVGTQILGTIDPWDTLIKQGKIQEARNLIGNTYGISDSLSTGTKVTNSSDLTNKLSAIQEKIKNNTATPTDIYEQIRLSKIDQITRQKTDSLLQGYSFEDKELLRKYANYSDDSLNKGTLRADQRGKIKGDIYESSIVEREMQKVKELRKGLTSETNKQLKDVYQIESIAPETVSFNDMKVEGTNESVLEYVNRYVKQDIKNFDIVTQDGVPIEELIKQMSEEEKSRIKDISSSSGEISAIAPEISVDKMTRLPIMNGSPALVGNISSKYSDVLGKQVYLVPKTGYESNMFRELINRRGVADNEKNNTEVYLSQINPRLAQQAEQSFQGLLQFTPNLFANETDEYQIAQGMPIIEVKSNGNTFEYRFKHPETNEYLSSSKQAKNFVKIRDDYYNSNSYDLEKEN